MLSDDTNTHGYNEWFFFRFRVDALLSTTTTFYIVNMHKKSSLHTDGFRVSVYSSRKNRWEKAGNNIQYYSSKLKRTSRTVNTHYYCLSF